MRVHHKGLTFLVEPANPGWKVCEIRTGKDPEKKNFGKEYESGVRWPGTFAQALASLLDRMVALEVTPDIDLTDAVATVAHLYRVIASNERMSS